jgi:DNA-directed RNA polymerase alpha subunit
MTQRTLSRIYENTPVEQLGLNARASNVMRRAGITTVGQLLDQTVGELLDQRALGVSTLGHILSALGDSELARKLEVLERKMTAILAADARLRDAVEELDEIPGE